MGLQKIEKTIHELRLIRGLTVQASSNLSGISVASIKRFEQHGTGNVPAFTICKLLMVYGTNMDYLDVYGVPTSKQILESILSGSCNTTPNGKIEVDVGKVIVLMKAEGFKEEARALYKVVNPHKQNAQATGMAERIG
jgi:transcriptional regulator with XRE-family HTH domain